MTYFADLVECIQNANIDRLISMLKLKKHHKIGSNDLVLLRKHIGELFVNNIATKPHDLARIFFSPVIRSLFPEIVNYWPYVAVCLPKVEFFEY